MQVWTLQKPHTRAQEAGRGGELRCSPEEQGGHCQGAHATCKLSFFSTVTQALPVCSRHMPPTQALYSGVAKLLQTAQLFWCMQVNADEHKALGTRFGVGGFPTLKYFSRGQPVDEPSEYAFLLPHLFAPMLSNDGMHLPIMHRNVLRCSADSFAPELLSRVQQPPQIPQGLSSLPQAVNDGCIS